MFSELMELPPPLPSLLTLPSGRDQNGLIDQLKRSVSLPLPSGLFANKETAFERKRRSHHE